MKEVYPKIFLLKGFCNCYYIDDKVKILIDAGFDFSKKVDFLILTHLHPDHVFFAKRIQERTGCKILIGEKDNILDLMFKEFGEWNGEKIKKFEISNVLKNNDEIDTGEYVFKIIDTPGHSLGSICLYEEKHKILFSGDTIFNDGFIGRTDFLHSDDKLMKKTLKELNELEIKHLFAGHGRV